MSLLLAYQAAPSGPTTKNYYSGGFANRQRLSRGIGWVASLLIAFAHGGAL